MPRVLPVVLARRASDLEWRKELEEKLHQSQKMDAVDQLAGGIAQDFNNLLLVIHGHAELVLRNEKRLSERSRHSLKQVTDAAERATNLIRQLLALSQKQVIQVRPFNLNRVIVNLTKRVNRIIGENISFRCQLGESLPSAQGDAGMIEQVLINLIVNARDAMPEGGSLFITTELANIDAAYLQVNSEAAIGKFNCVIVRDTGSGIESEHLGRIFEPFFTTKEMGQGTGLGLAMVYGIVQQHQGWVEVSTQRGEGTIFKIFLPATNSRPKGKIRPQTDKSTGHEKILLVDDEAGVRSFIRTVLEKAGYKVEEAANGTEALKVWQSEARSFDLLLTDIVMPGGVYGKELAEWLQRERPELKVIFMSGNNPYLEGKDQLHGYFLQKPFSVKVLTGVVRGYLDSNLKE